SDTTRKFAPVSSPRRPIHVRLSSPWLWGPLFTISFYLAIPRLPIDRELVSRLFCGHWSLYSEMALFFFAFAELTARMIRLFDDSRGPKTIAIDAASLAGIAAPAERARALLLAAAGVPSAARETKLMLRIRDACDYVARRGSGAAIEEHLHYLGDLAAESL